MSSVTFRAECRRVEVTGNWDVSCLRCGCVIGEMTSEILRNAIWATAHKGGVLCPKCRSESCKYCGVEMRDVDRVDNNLLKGICLFCELEERDKFQLECSHGFRPTIKAFQGGFEGCPLCKIESTAVSVASDKACLVSHISSRDETKAEGEGLAQKRIENIFSEDDVNTCMGCGWLWKPRYNDGCGNCGSIVSQPWANYARKAFTEKNVALYITKSNGGRDEN